MNSFFKGTALLVAAAFIGECLEFVINMVLARELGEKGMGLYMTILPMIFLVMVIASLELPVSISKFVAEKEEQVHRSMLAHVFRFTVYMTVMLLAVAAVILPLIPVFGSYHPMVRWLLVILIPIISFSSIARGYFMGLHHMGKIAFSNLLRKAAMLVLLIVMYQLFQFDQETALLVALCTLIGSELIVMAYLTHVFILQWQYIKNRPHAHISSKKVRDNLLAVSLPTTALRIFHAITNAAQPFLIKFALIRAGVTEVAATEHFGMLAGVAMTIGFFPAFIAHSLMIALIPTVSRANAKNDREKLAQLLQQVMVITALYGIPAVMIFNVFAEPLARLFFDSAKAAIYLQMLWPYFLFHFFVIPMQAFLIGLGLVKDALYHSIWSTIVSFSLIFFLGSLKEFKMGGVIIGMNAGILLLTLMHYVTICKKIGIPLTSRKPVRKMP